MKRIVETVKIVKEVEDSEAEQLREDWEANSPGDRLYYFNEAMTLVEEGTYEHTFEVLPELDEAAVRKARLEASPYGLEPRERDEGIPLYRGEDDLTRER